MRNFHLKEFFSPRFSHQPPRPLRTPSFLHGMSSFSFRSSRDGGGGLGVKDANFLSFPEWKRRVSIFSVVILHFLFPLLDTFFSFFFKYNISLSFRKAEPSFSSLHYCMLTWWAGGIIRRGKRDWGRRLRVRHEIKMLQKFSGGVISLSRHDWKERPNQT